LGQFAARKQYLPPAFATFQADIRSKPDHPPLISSAWMGFPQHQDIFQA
jgi:hypothetical protein